jgi:hypothetical protein|eukprot:GHVR01072567.1.p2 GENE.GHVR01072567.1~~GHVR01072567.1.p2  ORF type:complete len:100 (+),score=7.20 GHVR01072567.1:262-561(+)
MQNDNELCLVGGPIMTNGFFSKHFGIVAVIIMNRLSCINVWYIQWLLISQVGRALGGMQGAGHFAAPALSAPELPHKAHLSRVEHFATRTKALEAVLLQ